MSGQLLDMYVKITSANFQHYVQDDVVRCNSVFARAAVLGGHAIYCNSSGTEIVPSWHPEIVSAAVENATATRIDITFDMAMAITDETGWSATVAGGAATINSAAASDNEIRLTLSAAVTNGQEVLISYDASAGNTENTGGDIVSADVVTKGVTNNVAA